MVIGTIHEERAGVMSLSPSTAEITLIAGVIMPSPYNSPDPNTNNNSNQIGFLVIDRIWLKSA
jgi:hypothetical protein